MEETGGTLDSKGLFFTETVATFPGNTVKKPSTDETIQSRVKMNRYRASQYIELLKAFLKANAESWPTYNGQTGPLYNRDNTNKKSFWA